MFNNSGGDMESKGNIIVVADKDDHVSARILMDALGEKHSVKSSLWTSDHFYNN